MSALDNKKRFCIQTVAALLQNAHLKGFFTGQIYPGAGKSVCVPGLNCYSCPGAVGACPIGSLQNFLGSRKFRFPYYVVGLLIFFGALLGRAVCGFLCPFGFLQDILHKIPFPKKIRTFKGDRILRKLKYIVLLATILLPLFCKLLPVFCKYVCPSGTLSGVLLSLADTRLVQLFGGQFFWKLSVLCFIVLLSVLLYRPFCKYLCPLGAIYAPFNKVSLLQLQNDTKKCTHCKACANACEMCVDPVKNPTDTECIRCGKCINVCPTDALRFKTSFSKKPSQEGTK